MTLEIALLIVAILIIAVGLVSGAVAIWLVVQYYKYNRKPNSIGLSGIEIARKILDDHGLSHIKVKKTGSLLFGNSYSHYFKKVRLRGHIKNEKSITSIGMGAQKAALAILDKENDPDMRHRIRMVPFVSIGPFAFIPLIVIGALLDYFVFNQSGICVLIFGILALLFYAYTIIFSVKTLKTEKKAQERAYTILREEYNATEEELNDLKALFRLYNIQYINDIILSSLELLYTILQMYSSAKSGNS